MSLRSLARLAIPQLRAAGNAARFLRRLASDVDELNGDALNTPAWYLSPATGNDSNNGTTASTPIATVGELENRIGGRRGPISTNAVVVNVLDDITENINITVDPTVGSLGVAQTLTFKGAALPPVLTDALTAVTTFSIAGDLFQGLTAAGLGAGHVGLLVRFTSGLAINATARILASLGAGAVLTTVPQTMVGSVITNASAPAPGDTFVVEDQVRISGSMWLAHQGSLVFEDLELAQTLGFAAGSFGPIDFRRCLLMQTGLRLWPKGSRVIMANSLIRFSTSAFAVEGTMLLQGGGLLSEGASGPIVAQAGGLVQGSGNGSWCGYGAGGTTTALLRAVDGGIVSNNGAAMGFLNAVDGVRVGVGGVLDSRGVLFGGAAAAALSGYGINMDVNSFASYTAASPPSIPATTGSVNVAGTPTGYTTPAAAAGANYQARLGL
jgi:hypothetical protein